MSSSDLKLEDFGFKNVNLYFSGSCNLDCVYCFQPKISGHMNQVNKDIANWLSSRQCEKDILKYFGPNIDSISFWGGEPSLNLPYFVPVLEYFYQSFSYLKSIDFSTNISSKKLADNIFELVKETNRLNSKYNRKVHIEVQFSIDGPPEINDVNRKNSSVSKILENINYLLSLARDNGLDSTDLFSTHTKSTMDSKTLAWFLEHNDKYGTNLNYHYHFFDEILEHWNEFNNSPKGSGFITTVYPGHYTQEDGKNYAKIHEILLSDEFRNQDWKGFEKPLAPYSQTIQRLQDAFRCLNRGQRRRYKGEFISNTSCSAGKSSLGLTYKGQLSACHATYFLDEEALNYTKEKGLISEFEELNGFSFQNFNLYAKDNLSTDISDTLKTVRNLNHFKYFVSDIAGRLQYLELIISQLALSGQISECYLKPEWLHFAESYFLFGDTECPSNNILEFGSLYVRDCSHIKLHCNGTLELLSNYLKNGKIVV